MFDILLTKFCYVEKIGKKFIFVEKWKIKDIITSWTSLLQGLSKIFRFNRLETWFKTLFVTPPSFSMHKNLAAILIFARGMLKYSGKRKNDIKSLSWLKLTILTLNKWKFSKLSLYIDVNIIYEWKKYAFWFHLQSANSVPSRWRWPTFHVVLTLIISM